MSSLFRIYFKLGGWAILIYHIKLESNDHTTGIAISVPGLDLYEN